MVWLPLDSPTRLANHRELELFRGPQPHVVLRFDELEPGRRRSLLWQPQIIFRNQRSLTSDVGVLGVAKKQGEILPNENTM